jgi:aquaporin NIP
VVRFGITAPRFSWHQSFCLEFIFTFWLMMVTLGSSTHGRAIHAFAGLAVGATVALAALIGGPISGASMNPARSIGPALVSGVWNGLWIYVAATVLGAMTAAVAYRFLHE